MTKIVKLQVRMFCLKQELTKIKWNQLTQNKKIYAIEKLSCKYKKGSDLRILINDCEYSDDILIILNENIIPHVSVYSMAIKKCGIMKNYKNIIEIMDRALDDKIELDINLFNIFFNEIIKYDKINLAKIYFKTMIHKYGIIPDNITIGTLFKGCSRQPRMYIEFVEKLRSVMDKCDIKYTNHIISELIKIYSKMNDAQMVDELFEKRCEDTEIIFGVYINALGKLGQTPKFDNVLSYMKRNDIGLNAYHFNGIMKGYLENMENEKVLNIYNILIQNELKPHPAILTMKYQAIFNMQNEAKNNGDLILEEQYHSMIMNEFLNELHLFGLNEDFYYYGLQLSSIITHNKGVNPSNIITFFNEHKQHWNYIQNRGNNVYWIDLHLLYPLQAQFIIRYFFAFELETLKDPQSIIIYCGIRRHSSNTNKNITSIRDFIINEISKWDPKININTNDDWNITIHLPEIKKILENNPTICYFKDVNLSNNWYDYTSNILVNT